MKAQLCSSRYQSSLQISTQSASTRSKRSFLILPPALSKLKMYNGSSININAKRNSRSIVYFGSSNYNNSKIKDNTTFHENSNDLQIKLPIKMFINKNTLMKEKIKIAPIEPIDDNSHLYTGLETKSKIFIKAKQSLKNYFGSERSKSNFKNNINGDIDKYYE